MDNYKPSGLFVNENEKGQFVYSDFLIDGGYVIPKSEFKKYRIYAFRYIIGIIAGVLISTFTENIKICLIVGCATALIGEIIFRLKFLRSCMYLPRYVRPKKPLLDELTASSTKTKKIIKMLLFLIFAVCIVLNTYMEQHEGFMFIASWIIGVGSFIMFLLYVISLIKDGGKK